MPYNIRHVVFITISILLTVCYSQFNYPLLNQCDDLWNSSHTGLGNAICSNGSFMTSLAMAMTGTAVPSYLNTEPFPNYNPAQLASFIRGHPNLSIMIKDSITSDTVIPGAIEAISSHIIHNTSLDFHRIQHMESELMEVCGAINQDNAFFLADTTFSRKNDNAVVLVTSCSYDYSSNTFDLQLYHPIDGVMTTSFHELTNLYQFYVAYTSQERSYQQQRVLQPHLPPVPYQRAIPLSSQNVPFKYDVFFRQCDPQWGSDFMQTKTICQVGCLMNSVCVGLRNHGIKVDGQDAHPGNFNQFIRNNDGYHTDDFIHSTVSKVCGNQPNCSANFADDGFHRTNDLSPGDLQSYLRAKRLMVAAVKNGGHFVLAYGWDNDQPDHILTRDSAGSSGREWYPMQEIVGWRIYDMIGPRTNSTRFDY